LVGQAKGTQGNEPTNKQCKEQDQVNAKTRFRGSVVGEQLMLELKSPGNPYKYLVQDGCGDCDPIPKSNRDAEPVTFGRLGDINQRQCDNQKGRV
jgi:hypothetical protein